MSHNVSVLYTAEEIARRNKELAVELSPSISESLLIVALLRGSFVFAADLIREMSMLNFHPEIDFMTLSSYGNGAKSTGNVKIDKDIKAEVNGRDVLIIDDILESGRTVSFARKLLLDRGANNVKVAVLLEKAGKRAVDVDADFVGFRVPDLFVVGYGLDYANRHRELPYIGVVDTSN